MGLERGVGEWGLSVGGFERGVGAGGLSVGFEREV